jgi:thiamine pyrophosphate-dependent acetolactate synthase large subunit-like protein
MFGLIGDGNLFMADSFVSAGGRYVSVAHESAAVLAASGFARRTGGVGVATVTHGPAFTNTLTALVESERGAVPVVLLAGDTAVSKPESLQNIDQSLVAAAGGVGFVQLRGPGFVAADVARAFRQAALEQRPVVLNMPIDLQWEELDDFRPHVLDVTRQQARPDADVLDAALGLIASAQRPLVLVGRGAMDAKARSAVLSFARRIGAPIVTTLKARDLYRGEPESVGIFGNLSDDRTISIAMEADCIVSFGAALTHWTTAEGDLVRHARTVQVDHELAALGKHVVVDVGVHADAAAAASAFIDLLDEGEVEPSTFSARVSARPGPSELPAPVSEELQITDVLQIVDAELDQDRTLVLDAGRFFHHAARLVHSRAGGGYVHTVDFGSIGLSLATALGVSVAEPDHPVLVVIGDGGFMLGGVTEFNTAVRHGLNIVVVVINDAAYGAEHIQFRRRAMDPRLSTFDWPDLAQVARALGGAGFSVSSRTELEGALAQLTDVSGPVLIDVHLDVDGITSSRHH